MQQPPAPLTAAQERVLEAAQSWLVPRTPYHHMGRVKGVGVDCSMLLAEVYHEAGLMPKIAIKPYPHDWHLHRSRELYIEELTEHAVEIDGPPLPGDIALWQFGRTFSHGAIVEEWPNIIHSYLHMGVVRENVDTAAWLTHIGENGPSQGKVRPVKFYRPKGLL